MKKTRSGYWIHAARPALLGMAWMAASLPAAAEGGHLRSGPVLPQYRQECAACHIAYPAGLLPAASWQRVLQGLPHHFGTDASLDPKTVRQLSDWLGANAGTGRRAAEPPEDRITRSAWFLREHDEVPSSAWQRTSIRSASNCAACHGGAEQGDFNEHSVRIPR